MAQHIQSIASSTIPRVTVDEFLRRCYSGMTIFCEGFYEISEIIKGFTKSPFSHVATIIWLEGAQRWGVLEATAAHGVHIGHLDYYLKKYNGNIVLCASPALTPADVSKLLQAQFDLVDEGYDFTQEISMVAHKLIKAVPIIQGKHELFCSGLYEVGRLATSVPLQFQGPGMASPEQVWTDPSITPVCALVKA